MDPNDLNIVANLAAKAANAAIAGHEGAKHSDPVPEKDLSGGVSYVGPTPSEDTVGQAGFVEDGNGNRSSKRLESLLGFGVAAAVAILGIILVPSHLTEVAAVAGAFLTYSLAMQGVSAASERNMSQ